MIDNRISLDITETQKTAVEEARAKLADTVKNFQIQIDKEELKSLPKMSDGRVPFADKTAQYAVSNPEFLPPFADVPEFNKDLKTYKEVNELIRPLLQTIDNLINVRAVSGSEAYQFALNYYRSAQYHAKMGVPGAQTIVDDLRRLFETKTTAPETPETPTE